MSRPISVVISSLRPERLEETIDSTAMHSDLVEVVVASPTPPKPRDFVKHIPVPAPGASNELSWSQKNNLAVKAASGKYIVVDNDDIHFRPGWAPIVLKHMEERGGQAAPYLALFEMSIAGKRLLTYTAFGLLYSGHGCIRRSDLAKVGGTLFDERYWLGYNDVDLALRVWHAGGSVKLLPEVVMDIDYDKPHSVTNPYREMHYDRDGRVFIEIWFPRHFKRFVQNYHWLRDHFSPEDNVLPRNRQNSSALRELIIPYYMTKCFDLLGLSKWPYAKLQRHRLARVVNRRWNSFDYSVPYKT